MRLLSVLMWSALCLMLIMTATMRNAAAEETAANGVFLVATRDIRDPNFKESVILITHPQDSGPFGVIINRPLAHRVSALFPGNAALQGRDDVVYSGGPVGRQTLVFLVRTTQAPPRGTRVLNDVYFTPDTVFAKDPATIWPELIKRATQRRTHKTDPLHAAAYP